MDSFPRTPFSTPLSGSAREAEGRIRNKYQKKRPPALLLALSCALALTCGGLVSCQSAAGGSASDTGEDTPPITGPGIAMAIQYYDTSLNYIEVPRSTPGSRTPRGRRLSTRPSNASSTPPKRTGT